LKINSQIHKFKFKKKLFFVNSLLDHKNLLNATCCTQKVFFQYKKERTKLNIKTGSLFVIQISSTAPHFSHLTQHLYE
ncbi:hypothetical protein, partial [Bacillus thuringiensis]|uniref:hypothetical protein n=1 Tax=Bacillus thuringiensis TaxID=1428 RepID=UPI001BB04DFF